MDAVNVMARNLTEQEAPLDYSKLVFSTAFHSSRLNGLTHSNQIHLSVDRFKRHTCGATFTSVLAAGPPFFCAAASVVASGTCAVRRLELTVMETACATSKPVLIHARREEDLKSQAYQKDGLAWYGGRQMALSRPMIR